MTFRDLQKLVQAKEEEGSRSSSSISRLQAKLHGKPFWFWDQPKHRRKHTIHQGACCFNHIIGLPRKDGIEKPMFDYELDLYRALLQPGYLNSRPGSIPQQIIDDKGHRYDSSGVTYSHLAATSEENIHKIILHPFKEKHLWVKKATGLGVTEFFLRLMAWLCLRNNDYQNSQIVIITGPNQDLAIKLIKRMKGLFEPHGITFSSKETVIELNGCSIEAFPSNHIDAFRSLANPKFILIDEGDFFRKNEQQDVRNVAERYIGKSDPYIVMVSTPNAPDGLFEKIEKEPFDKCIYKRVFLDYTYGLNKIYTKEEIDKASASPSFNQEYCLKYLGIIGNVFSPSSIEKATSITYNPLQINQHSKKSIGLDPGFGSSNFAIVATQLVDGKIQVIHAEEYDRDEAGFSDMIHEVWKLKQRCGHVTNIYVDAANPEIWQALKKEFDEPFDEKTVREKKAYAMKYNLHVEDQMFIVPVPFSVEGAKMLQHTKWLLEEREEDGSSLIAIHKEKFHKLVTALRTAVANEYKLDKEVTSFNDILDAFRLSLQFYKRTKA